MKTDREVKNLSEIIKLVNNKTSLETRYPDFPGQLSFHFTTWNVCLQVLSRPLTGSLLVSFLNNLDSNVLLYRNKELGLLAPKTPSTKC